MSSVTTTTINTKDGATNLTLSTGNTSGPAIVVGSTTEVWIRGNSSSNSASINATSFTVNVASTIANNLTVANNLNIGNTLSVTGNVSISGNVATLSVTGNVAMARANVTTNTGLTLGTSSLTGNGYSYLPNGLLFQWGTSTANSTSAVTFPIAFTTTCFNVQATGVTGGGSANIIFVNSISTTGANIRSGNTTAAGPSVYWTAIGV